MGGGWPAAPKTRGRGGNLANLQSPGGCSEGRGGARPEAGKAGAGGGGGAAGPGAACRGACAGPRGCASRSRTLIGASPPHPGAVTVRASPRAGDCDALARGGAPAPAGTGAWVLGQAGGGWAPAGGGREGAEVSTGTWRGAPLLCGRLGAAVGAVGGGRRAVTPGRAWRRRWEVGASSGTAPAGGCSAKPQILSGMERGWRLAWDDERRGDVGEEGMASLGLRCPLSRGCGTRGLGGLLARAAGDNR